MVLNKKIKKVFVGISGGVDSAVSAFLLKKSGFEVEGVFIKTWQPDWVECTWRAERRDAMRVCAQLGIKYNDLDLESLYKENVADYMIEEYKLGRTPNPDVMCNREVKFGGMLDWAMARGADFVATGHYASIIDYSGQKVLAKGLDEKKDQSYFLWTLKPSQLEHVMFPLGSTKKSIVRKTAKRAGLFNAKKKDSQGICFLGKIDMFDFLSHYVESRPGVVKSETGEDLGYHRGALFFTFGQRHGFTIVKKSPNDSPWYVVGKDLEKNTIIVSQSIVNYNKTNLITLSKVNYLISAKFNVGEVLECVIRYHGSLKKCEVVAKSNHFLTIKFFDVDQTISPGQSVVFYNNDICLGGGVVEKLS